VPNIALKINGKKMSCDLNKTTNYAGKGNAADIPNTNTAGYTYRFCPAVSLDLIMLDQSFLIAGVTIVNVEASVFDGVNKITYSGAINFVFDVSTLDLTKSWRIDYEIELSDGSFNTAPAVFFRPYVDYECVGTSDPNCPPLRECNDTLATGTSPAVCYHYIQAVPAATWNINHNLGKTYPCGWHIIDAGGNTVLSNVVPVDANNLTVFFGLAIAGRITLTF
jgi:hypothetical protein